MTQKKWKELCAKINNVMQVAKANKSISILDRLTQNGNNDFITTIIIMKYHNALYLSKSTYYEIVHVVDEYLSSTGKLNSTNKDAVIDSFIENLTVKFKQNQNRNWNKDNLERLLDESIKKNNTSSCFTHFIPCILPDDNMHDEFNIGCIKFLKTKKFWINYYKKVYALNDFEYDVYLDTKKDFEKYNWVAIVAINNCSRNESLNTALECIRMSITFISIYFDHQFIELTSDSVFGKNVHSSGLVIDNDRMQFIFSKKYNLNDSGPWIDEFFKRTNKNHIACFSKLLDDCVNHKTLPILSRKFYDSIGWYDIGIRSHDDSIKLICMITAIEYLIQYRKSDKTTKNFQNRVKFFLRAEIEQDSSMDKLINNAYDIRSKILHGAAQRDSLLIKQNAYKTVQLCILCLLHFIDWATIEGFSKEVTIKDIEAYFKKYI